MGWSKNKGLRLFFERAKKTYLLIDTSAICPDGAYECIGELYIDNNPKKPVVCGTSCSPEFLYKKCRRASWSDMPRVWRGALRKWITGSPRKHRGLWRTSELKPA